MIRPLDLLPGESLGPFALGSTLFSVLNLLRSQRTAYPSAKLVWDDEASSPTLNCGARSTDYIDLQAPSASEIYLILTSPPLALLFEPLSQRLARIEVTGEARSWVAYRGQALREGRGDEEEDVVKTVRRVMGPTYNSGPESGEGEEVLGYPGVAFSVARRADDGSSLARIILTPLPTPPNIPVGQAWLHPVLPDSPAVAEGDLSLVEVKLDSHRKPSSVSLHFHSGEGTPTPPVVLRIGATTSEDLMCDLGSPVRTFWKEDDRMSIHGSRSSVDPALQRAASLLSHLPSPELTLSSSTANPYFVSHPHLGLTFLLHPTKHILLKIILHSNLPGEINFGRTSRCRWELVDSGGERRSSLDPFSSIAELLASRSSAETIGSRSIPGADDLLNVNSGAGSRVGSVDSNRSGSPASTGSKVGGKKGRGRTVEIEVFRPSSTTPENEVERPMVLDRAADGGEGPVKGKTTEIHGFPGIALEVTGSSDIETVWLF
uniref:Uncharacterized protein n=1 Tax=Leucosporidium scottii TaxID=5278 RepID=A0A0H5FTQ3_9BASI|nr:hypothetical protein ls5930a1_00122 [Leucosporidium scottii]